MTYLRFEEGCQLLKLALSALLASMLLTFGWAGCSQAAELRFNRAYVGTLSGQTFATTTLLNADPGSIRFADGGNQRAFQNTSGTLYYTVGGVQYSEAGVLNSRYPNGNTMIDAVAFTANSGGDRLLVLGGSYTAGTSYSGSSNAVVAKLNEYLDATAPDAGQTILSVNGASSATVSVGQTATILVTVKLSSGAGLAGASVALNANPSGNTTISPASAVTNSSGQATFSVQSSVAGSVTYSATASANGSTFTSTATVTVTSVGVRSPAQSSAVVPGGSAGLPTLVIITVRDSGGNPVSGAAAALSANIGGSNAGTSVSAITDRGGGSYGFSYTPTIAGTDAVSIKLDGTNISGSPYTSLVAAPTLSFAPAPGGLPDGAVGTAYSQTIMVTGGTAPYSFTATGLPAGLALNAATGTISGTPTAAGSYNLTVSVTDAHGATGSATYTVAIGIQAPAAGASAVTVAANGSPTTVPLSLTGGAATSVAVATIPSHGTATASGTAISYTPNAGFSGGDSFTYTATNSAGTSAPAMVTVTVSAPTLVFSPAPGGLPNGTVGAAYTQTFTVTGGTAPYSFSATGLPAGLTLNATTGAIIGTPTSAGNHTIAITATDTHGAGGSANYVLNIGIQAPVAGSTSLAVVANSAATSVPLSLSGGTAASVAVAAAPAHGIATASGTAISYAPNPGFSGSDSFTYTATNAAGTSAPATVTVTVSTPTLSFAPAPGGLPNGTAGTAYNQTITITGGTAPYSFTATGLPAGLTINAATGAISGSPAAAGSYIVTVSSTDAHSATGAATYTVAISVQAPIAGAATVAVAANSSATAVPLSLAGGTAASVAVASAPAHGTATANGTALGYTPNAGFSGTDSFTYTATNAAGTSAPATVTVTVSAPVLVFSPAPGALPNGTVGTAYNQTITVSGGTAPYSFTATGLPAGLTLNAATGTVTGTPTTDGSFAASVTATDAYGAQLAQSYSIVIAPPPPPVAADSTSASVPANTETKAGQNVAINLTSLVSGEYTDIRIVRQPQHGSVAITRTVAMRAAGTPGMMAALAVFGMLEVPSQVIAIYTPDPNYHGADSFQFAAVGPGGVSAPASVVINVVGRIPTAQALTANTLDGQSVLVDLTAGATEGPFIDAAIVSVSPAQQATAEMVPAGSGTSRSFKIRVTPKARFSGAVLVQYTLTNAFGTSAPAVVTVNVTRRPDPSADPVVQAISDGQAEAARRFSQAQVSNFLRRTETLHGDCGRSFNGMRLASRDVAPQAAEPHSDDAAEMRRGDRRDETEQQQRVNARRGVETGCRSVAVWSGGTVELGTRDAATGRAKISAATSGLSGGVDAKVSQGLYLGAGAGLSRDISRIDGGKGHLFSKGTTLALYGSVTPVPGLFVDGVATTSWTTFRTRRTDATTGALASGERSGRLTSLALSMGIDRVSGPLGWSVYGRAATSNGSLHRYVEEGAGVYDLRFDSRAIRSTTAALGFRTAVRQALQAGSLTVNLRGEWQHEFQSGSLQGVDYADIAGPSAYRLRAQNWGREQFVLAPGIDLDLPADWQFTVDFGFRGAMDERAMSTSVRVRKQF